MGRTAVKRMGKRTAMRLRTRGEQKHFTVKVIRPTENKKQKKERKKEGSKREADRRRLTAEKSCSNRCGHTGAVQTHRSALNSAIPAAASQPNRPDPSAPLLPVSRRALRALSTTSSHNEAKPLQTTARGSAVPRPDRRADGAAPASSPKSAPRDPARYEQLRSRAAAPGGGRRTRYSRSAELPARGRLTCLRQGAGTVAPAAPPHSPLLPRLQRPTWQWP